MSMDMKASIPFLIFFWVWAGATVAQNTSADSLAAVVEQLPDDTAKVRRLYELGRAIGRENTPITFSTILSAASGVRRLPALARRRR